MTRVYVTGRGAITPAGLNLEDIWQQFTAGRSALRFHEGFFKGPLPHTIEPRLAALRTEKEYRSYDTAMLLGVLAAEEASYEAGSVASDFGVFMASSRGASETLETAHASFVEKIRLRPTTSPATTMGSFAAAVAKRLDLQGPSLTISSACSSSLHALGLASLYLKSGMMKGAIAGGAEAALTPFTLSMLDEARVYSQADKNDPFPCRPFHDDRTGLVLSDGAACVVLETDPENLPLAELTGYGAATEQATLTGISTEGRALQKAVVQALKQAKIGVADVGFVILHGSGTKKGDAAELNALNEIFGKKMPPLVAHKWLMGHMLGAAGAFSVAMAIQHLAQGTIPAHPYFAGENSPFAKSYDCTPAKHVLVVASGFGGNAAALVLSAV